MGAKLKKDAKSNILKEIEDNKEALKVKLDRFIDQGKESRYYKRKLDKIMEIMKDKCFYEGKASNVLSSADFYQKIELFMDYDG